MSDTLVGIAVVLMMLGIVLPPLWTVATLLILAAALPHAHDWR
jgi:hypothetical protein